MSNDLLDIINSGDFARLFINKLGWNQPTRAALTVTVDNTNYTLTEIAEYRGLGVWHCPAIPNGATKRAIDKAVANETIERLIIYTHDNVQEWCWPRINKYRHSGAPTLVAHPHTVGEPNPDLIDRLERIRIKIGTQPTVVDVLNSMREAFDREAETASVQAARLMGTLYEHLAGANMPEQDASLFLARVLFLMFGDDTEMWGHGKKDLFLSWLQQQDDTEPRSLAAGFSELFDVADTPTKDRPESLSSTLAAIPYINGGVFDKAVQITIPPLDGKFHQALIEACGFDWGRISPAVFGSMFQAVKDKEARRSLGEHYTTEANILRTIEPLFLSEIRTRLQMVWDDLQGLVDLHQDLADLRFLDPACGCGNFLIVTYRELRGLELELLKRRNELALLQAAMSGDYPTRRRTAKPGIAQMSFDPTHDLHITLDQFYGLELEAWPAKIAETAMFLVDHLANKAMEDELGTAPHRLPIQISPHIYNVDALHTDWRSILTAGPGVYIFGNPPFRGAVWLTSEQIADKKAVFAAIGSSDGRNGRLDYVACWYAKAIEYMKGSPARAAFVSTNSITQGEQGRCLLGVFHQHGFGIDFAHRTFRWTSEATSAAAVHVVIIGFSGDRGRASTKWLFEYPSISGEPVRLEASHINFFLVDAPDIAPARYSKQLVQGVPTAILGSKPADGGHLVVTPDEYQMVASDPIARKYLRPYVGASEMLQGRDRWCLRLESTPESEIRESRLLQQRLSGVRESRLKSPNAAIRRQAELPHLFSHEAQPTIDYLALPEVSSENRDYLPTRYFGPETVASNQLVIWPGAPLWMFTVVSSRTFAAWVRTFGGRLKSDIRVAPGTVLNNFPFSRPKDAGLAELEEAGQELLGIRANYPERTLAQLYAPKQMPSDLRTAHEAVDAIVDGEYGIDSGGTDADRIRVLVAEYVRLGGEAE